MRLKIVEVSRVFHSLAPFKAQLLHIMCIARFQYFPCIVLVFLGNLRGEEAKNYYYWECQVLLRITAFVGGNNHNQLFFP